MLLNIIIIIVLALLFFYVYQTYEGYNSTYPMKSYKPNTDTPIPTALDGTSFLSPDSEGNCPDGFQRDQKNENSLCHIPCKKGMFHYVGEYIYGCVLLNTEFPQGNYNGNYPLALDNKTNIVSPNIDATCPEKYRLDVKSGLCYSPCPNNKKFYGMNGCILMNVDYSQGSYDGSDNPYILTQDGKTNFVSPTSSATCPKGFILNHEYGLCHNPCPSGKKFNGTKSGSSFVGCE